MQLYIIFAFLYNLYIILCTIFSFFLIVEYHLNRKKKEKLNHHVYSVSCIGKDIAKCFTNFVELNN